MGARATPYFCGSPAPLRAKAAATHAPSSPSTKAINGGSNAYAPYSLMVEGMSAEVIGSLRGVTSFKQSNTFTPSAFFASKQAANPRSRDATGPRSQASAPTPIIQHSESTSQSRNKPLRQFTALPSRGDR